MTNTRFEEKFPIEGEDGSYNHLILDVKNDILTIKYESGFPQLKYTEEDMNKIQIKMVLVPKFLEGLHKTLFTPEEGYRFIDDGIEYSTFINIDDRISYARPLNIYQTINNETTGFTFDWVDTNVVFDLKKRVYPKGIYWLLDTLKKMYNDWQKEHPEHPALK